MKCMDPGASLRKTLPNFIGKKPDSFLRFDNDLKYLHDIINNYCDAQRKLSKLSIF